MTHKYERISKVIKETFGEPSQLLRKFTNMSDAYIKDHDDLVRFAYAVLEEFDGPRVDDVLLKEYEHGHSKHFSEKQLILDTIKQLTEEGIVPTRRSICDRSGIDISKTSNLLRSLCSKAILKSNTTYGGRRVGRMVESFSIRDNKNA
jgi:hypothetical protein